MTSILIAVGVAAVLALIAGLILAIASQVFAVPKDELTEQLREALPGANCGACGYSGCDGYAVAMAHEGAAVGLCAPGGETTVKQTSELLGVSASLVKKAAVIHCAGCDGVSQKTYVYQGIVSCAAAVKMYGGDKACAYGCLGYGDCVSACDYDALTIENGVAVVDAARCVGCGACAKRCPKSLITVVEQKPMARVLCSSHDKGGVARKLCAVACIGCKKCEKACPEGAITVDNFLAKVNADACIGCGDCVASCPQGCLTM